MSVSLLKLKLSNSTSRRDNHCCSVKSVNMLWLKFKVCTWDRFIFSDTSRSFMSFELKSAYHNSLISFKADKDIMLRLLCCACSFCSCGKWDNACSGRVSNWLCRKSRVISRGAVILCTNCHWETRLYETLSVNR